MFDLIQDFGMVCFGLFCIFRSNSNAREAMSFQRKLNKYLPWPLKRDKNAYGDSDVIFTMFMYILGGFIFTLIGFLSLISRLSGQ